jgi:AcrR family transcriptional regulator
VVRAAPEKSKGDATRERIVHRALEIASLEGLGSLTIGSLAEDLGLSKSGLFAHFKSKERLQLEVLEAAASNFTLEVFHPALVKARGLPRLRAIFDNWLGWIQSNQSRGGCVFIAAAMEWDDREGEVRDAVVDWMQKLHAGLVRATELAVQAGDLRADVDVDGFANDVHGIALKYHLGARLMRLPTAVPEARASFERLVQSCAP